MPTRQPRPTPRKQSRPPVRSRPASVVVNVDPRDGARGETTLTEKLIDDAKQDGPGWLTSLCLHVLLLAVMWLLVAPDHRPFGALEGDEAIDSGFTFPKEQTDVREEPVPVPQPAAVATLAPRPIVPRNDERKQTGKVTGEPEPGRAAPAGPVDVSRLLDGRRPDARVRILKGLDPDERVERAVAGGLEWLKRHQRPGGNWELHRGYPDAGYEYLRTDTGATALALLAFLGDGQTHQDGPHGEAVENGLNWLRRVQKPNGDFHDHDEFGRQTAFYAHSQATIAVCEAYALTKDESLREPAERAVGYLVASQHPTQGGWKYQPQDQRSIGDLSVTGWQLAAADETSRSQRRSVLVRLWTNRRPALHDDHVPAGPRNAVSSFAGL